MSASQTSVRHGPRSRVLPWLVGGVVGAAVGLAGGWLIFAPAPSNAEVAALIDDYLAAWDAGDGEAVVSLMTEDGVHYSGGATTGKQANGGALGLAPFVERHAVLTFEPVSDPIVSAGPPYEAAVIVRVTGGGQDSWESLEAFRIEESEDGSLKIAVDNSEIFELED